MLALAVLLEACAYSFTGGGLPPHVRTIAVSDIENSSAQPAVAAAVQLELERELPRKLGVRLAPEGAADAVLRGRVTDYRQESGATRTGPQVGVDVVEYVVRVSMEAEIYDQKEDRVLWKTTSLSALGSYYPDRGEQPLAGEQRAIEQILQKVIQGAQSQW